MLCGDAVEPGNEFIDARVVLHRAGAERIDAQIDSVVPGRKTREVAKHFNLADFGKPFDAGAAVICAERLGGIGGGHIERRQFERALSGRRLLEDQPFALAGVARCFSYFCVHFPFLSAAASVEAPPRPEWVSLNRPLERALQRACESLNFGA